MYSHATAVPTTARRVPASQDAPECRGHGGIAGHGHQVFLQFPRVAAEDGAALVVSAVESLLHPSKNLKLREHNAHKCFKRR
jgi:hypothetical protein